MYIYIYIYIPWLARRCSRAGERPPSTRRSTAWSGPCDDDYTNVNSYANKNKNHNNNNNNIEIVQ